MKLEPQCKVRFAVNVDTRESDLTRPAPGDLVRATGRSNTLYIKPAERLSSMIARLRHGRELWRELLAAAMALLVVELWLGRTRRGLVAYVQSSRPAAAGAAHVG